MTQPLETIATTEVPSQQPIRREFDPKGATVGLAIVAGVYALVRVGGFIKNKIYALRNNYRS